MGVVVSFFGTATVSMSAWYPIHKTLSHIIEVGLDKNQGGHPSCAGGCNGSGFLNGSWLILTISSRIFPKAGSVILPSTRVSAMKGHLLCNAARSLTES